MRSPLIRWLPLVALALGTSWLLAGDDRAWGLARTTVLLAAATVAISLPVGTLLAWLLARTDLPGRRTVLGLVAVMLFVPLYLQAGAWQAGFGLQGWFPLIFHGPVLLNGFSGVVWIHALAAIPWVVLWMAAGFQGIDPELEEMALLESSPRQVFLRVSLPASRTALATAGLWVVILTAGEMTVTDLFAVRTFAEEIYTQLAVGPELGDTPWLATPGVVLSAWLVAAGWLVASQARPQHRPLGLRPAWRFGLGIWKIPALVAVAGVLAVLVGVPLGSLLYEAGVQVIQTDAGRLRTWSAMKCLAIVAGSPGRFGRELGWSCWIAGLAASGGLALGLPLAALAGQGGRWTQGVLALSAVGLALPGPVIGMGMLEVLSRPEIPGTLWLYDPSTLPHGLALPVRGFAPALTLLFRTVPPATLILWHALASFPGELLDAAALDGAGPLVRLTRVVLPCRLAALAVAWLIGFLVAVGDLSASLLVAPPGVTTLSNRIFSLLHYGIEDQVAGICLAMVVLFGLAAAVAGWLSRRWQREVAAVRDAGPNYN